MKRAVTLIEVNLAIMVMAVGVLGIISLYAFGYREESQSREDVASAAYADAVMGPLVTALTATNVVWADFNNIAESSPDGGWKGYLDNESTGKIKSKSSIKSLSEAAYSGTIGALNLDSVSGNWPVQESNTGDLIGALVVMHEKDSAVVRISFRAFERERMLFAAPLYYTEARFQGVMDGEGGGK